MLLFVFLMGYIGRRDRKKRIEIVKEDMTKSVKRIFKTLAQSSDGSLIRNFNLQKSDNQSEEIRLIRKSIKEAEEQFTYSDNDAVMDMRIQGNYTFFQTIRFYSKFLEKDKNIKAVVFSIGKDDKRSKNILKNAKEFSTDVSMAKSPSSTFENRFRNSIIRDIKSNRLKTPISSTN
ncbi:hypothetical protein [Leuconostoc holzapfelii]|nr:hypothetical protein [Leuconostoc holzapfelii]